MIDTRKIYKKSIHYTVYSKIKEMWYFIFYTLLDELIWGIDDRFSQETYNSTVSMGKMLKLQLDEIKNIIRSI